MENRFIEVADGDTAGGLAAKMGLSKRALLEKSICGAIFKTASNPDPTNNTLTLKFDSEGDMDCFLRMCHELILIPKGASELAQMKRANELRGRL